MAKLRITEQNVTVVLSLVEKLETMHRSVTIPRWAILGARAVPDGMDEARGIPGLGTHVPDVIMAGMFSRQGTSTFVICRGHRPAVVIDLSGQPFGRLIVTVDDPDAAVARLAGGLRERGAGRRRNGQRRRRRGCRRGRRGRRRRRGGGGR